MGLPLRAGREQARVVGHVELGGVADAPAVRAIVAQQHRVRIDLLQNLQVPRRLDFQNRPALGAEPRHLAGGVGRGQCLGAFPVVQAAAHEGGADGRRGAALLHDHRIELVAAVNWKQALAVLEAEQPLPSAARQEQAAQRGGAVVRIEAGGHHEAQPPAGAQERVGRL